jgi:hypothetical protein
MCRRGAYGPALRLRHMEWTLRLEGGFFACPSVEVWIKIL